MHNSEILIKGENRCTMLINSEDALQLNLTDKQIVKVVSLVGQVEIPIKITNSIKKGVLSIPHGFGHHRKGIKLNLAQQNAGVSINDLTNDKQIDALTGNADFSGTKVQIIP